MLRLLEPLDCGVQLAGALRDRCAKPGSLRLQLGVGKILQAHFVLLDRIHDRLDALEVAVESRPEDFREQSVSHYSSSDTARVP